MKIEIELAEVEYLREQIKALQERERNLEYRLKEARPEEMEKKAVWLSQKLFDKYMSETFKALGFKIDSYGDRAVEFGGGYGATARTWNDSEKYIVTLSAFITNEYRSAFLRLGLAMDKPEDSLLINSANP